MARQIVCDCCRKAVEETEKLKEEFNVLTIAKIITPSAPFERKDLCKDCTGEIRSFIQRGATTVRGS